MKTFGLGWSAAIALLVVMIYPGWAANQNVQNAALRKVERGISGKLWANGDDSFVLYLNDRKIADRVYTDNPEPKPVTLKPGDLLMARVVSEDAVRGFALLFQSGNGKVEFSTNTGDWFSFQPQNEARWWQVRDFHALSTVHATSTDHQEVRGNIERLSEAGCQETLWGDPSKSTVYLIKRVTPDDLME